MARALITCFVAALLASCDQGSSPSHDDGCSGSLPAVGDGAERQYTFPPRDFVCADSESPVCELNVPLRSPAERTVTVRNELGGATVVYLLDRLSLPVAAPDPDRGGPGQAEAVGFDLDRRSARGGSTSPDADCQERSHDYASSYEPGAVGIDNSFQQLISTIEDLLGASDCPAPGCLDQFLVEDVHAGRLLLLLELTGVDSLEHDPELTAAIYVARTVDGRAPVLEGMGASARVRAGQSFEILRAALAPAPADLFHHRLRVRSALLDLPRERFGYPTPLSHIELRATVCANGLFRGHLGGRSSVDDLVDQVLEIFFPEAEETIRSVVESVADIRPSADPSVCEFVSTAYAIEGVPAIRLP